MAGSRALVFLQGRARKGEQWWAADAEEKEEVRKGDRLCAAAEAGLPEAVCGRKGERRWAESMRKEGSACGWERKYSKVEEHENFTATLHGTCSYPSRPAVQTRRSVHCDDQHCSNEGTGNVTVTSHCMCSYPSRPKTTCVPFTVNNPLLPQSKCIKVEEPIFFPACVQLSLRTKRL